MATGQLSAQSPSSDHGLYTADGKMYVGADYYPEHWPEERWETDLQMMKEAGFNIVRVAEFSWVLFEPEEGKYEFDWLDRWLKLARKYDINVIMGTPTAIMPAWLARKYPEALETAAATACGPCGAVGGITVSPTQTFTGSPWASSASWPSTMPRTLQSSAGRSTTNSARLIAAATNAERTSSAG